MTNRADLWAGSVAPNPFAGNIERRSYDAARLINAAPALIVISRAVPLTGETIQLPPQTVRLELLHPLRGGSEAIDAMLNEISIQFGVIIGYRGHPTIPNTDVQRADRFFWGGIMWEVTDFMPTFTDILLATLIVKP